MWETSGRAFHNFIPTNLNKSEKYPEMFALAAYPLSLRMTMGHKAGDSR
jgi:hypothetical protein